MKLFNIRSVINGFKANIMLSCILIGSVFSLLLVLLGVLHDATYNFTVCMCPGAVGICCKSEISVSLSLEVVSGVQDV